MYCEDIEAWVFRHNHIRTLGSMANIKGNSTEDDNEENECHWLLRSPSTDDFDIISVAALGEWSVWKGVINNGYPITITCNECLSTADWYVFFYARCLAGSCETSVS